MTVPVKSLARVLLTPKIHQSIAWAAVPTAHITLGWEQAQIGDAADIQCGHGVTRNTKDFLMKGGHQRRALATGGQIAASEVRHHVDTRQFSQQGRIIQLQCVADCRVAQNRVSIELQRTVPHGLTMRADRRNL